MNQTKKQKRNKTRKEKKKRERSAKETPFNDSLLFFLRVYSRVFCGPGGNYFFRS